MRNPIFKFLENVSEAILIEDNKSGTVEYVNRGMLKLLNVQSRKESIEFNELFKFEEVYDELIGKLQLELSNNDTYTLKDVVIKTDDDKEILCNIKCGYYNEEQTYNYYVFKTSKAEKKVENAVDVDIVLADLPFPIIVLHNDDNLTIKSTNKKFDKMFNGQYITFDKMFKGQFSNSFVKEFRTKYTMEISSQLNSEGKCIIELDIMTAEGKIVTIGVDAYLANNDSGNSLIYATINSVEDEQENSTSIDADLETETVSQPSSQDLLYIFDISNKKINFAGDITKYDIPVELKNFPDDFLELGIVYEADTNKFIEMANNMARGIEKTYTMRLRDASGVLEWFRAEYDINKNTLEVKGKFVNIQQSTVAEQKLNADPLTQCLHITAFEKKVTKFIENKGKDGTHALFLINLDNFRTLNDNHGHYNGDQLLIKFVEELRVIFGSKTNYIGRSDGDEFVVFLKDFNNQNSIVKRAEKILKALDTTYEKNGTKVRITGSIGISAYPNHDKSCEGLIKKAYIALIDSKMNGKNTYNIFDSKSSVDNIHIEKQFKNAELAISKFFDTNLIQKLFNLALNSTDNNETINQILSTIGERFDADRCIIYEAMDEFGTYYKINSEYLKEGISSKKNMFNTMPGSMISDMSKIADDTDVVYYSNIRDINDMMARSMLEMQSVKSLIHSYVKNSDDVIKYILSFEECTSTRICTPIEISALMYAVRIIAQLMK